MFSTQYQSIWDSLEGLLCSTVNPAGEVREYSATECSSMLRHPGFGSGGELDGELRERAARNRREIYDGRVFMVVPLYVSSYCAEQCVYCNYRAGNHGVGVERKRLSDEELRREATYLIEEKGFRTIELVYANDPLMKPDVIARHIAIVREVLEQHGGGTVGLSCEALDEAEYKLLADAGLSFSVLWMETYDAARYAALHPGRLTKSRFEYRLDAYERMMSAGVPAVGIGILSGLSDWRRDWAMLMHHEEYLREKCGDGARILGIPRLKGAPGAVMQESEFIPTDAEFLATLALHTCFAKTTVPFVSTREDWETCIQIAQGGGCLFTLNCSTIPGGYSLETKGGQFANNSFDAPVFAPKLETMGFRPEFLWDVNDLMGLRTDTLATRGQ